MPLGDGILSEKGSLRAWLRRIYIFELDSSFLSTSWPQWHEQFSSTRAYYHVVSVIGPTNHGLNSLRPWVKINHSSLNCGWKVLCPSDRKATNTSIYTVPHFPNFYVHTNLLWFVRQQVWAWEFVFTSAQLMMLLDYTLSSRILRS